MMQAENKRLRKIQHLAHEIMDEMNAGKELNELERLIPVIDNLSRAIGDLTDAYGNYSIDYVEEKVKIAHTLLFKKDKVDMYQL
ncbi:group-specific protein [Lysinibacillus sp. NPDC097279]|uniref:group-specific protein n=1 Tax=unclassified Lysinibacillus TaxID=2636778 RepID=UPI00351DA743